MHFDVFVFLTRELSAHLSKEDNFFYRVHETFKSGHKHVLSLKLLYKADPLTKLGGQLCE